MNVELKKKFLFVFLPTGIKVIGGVKELTGEEFGVYVKRILPGGLASSDGKCRQSRIHVLLSQPSGRPLALLWSFCI